MSGGGGDPNAEKNSMNLLWIVFVVFVSALTIWYFFGYYFRWAFIEWRLVQTRLLTFLGADLEHVEYLLLTMLPEEITLDLAEYISDELAWYLLVPAISLMALMALLLSRGHVVMRFRKSYNMLSLARQEVETWPQIAPVINLGLAKEDIRYGPWAMAMNPMQFGKKYRLFDIERQPDRSAAWREGKTFMATVRKEQAFRVFSSQLGPLWEGVHRLPKYTRALFAIFASRMVHDTEPARALLMQLAKTAAKGEIDYTGTTALLRKHINKRPVKKCLESHAYVLTVMATMLTLARVDGVQASVDFLWLKPIDRRLWYVLNTVGRQVAFSEIAGPFAHWMAEKQLGRGLHVPMVEQAVIAFEAAVARTIYVPDEEEMKVLEGEQDPEEGADEPPSTEDLYLGED